MSACSKCGAELIGSKKFCASCGQPVAEPAPPPEPPQPSIQQAAPPIDPLGATALPGTRSPSAPDASPPGPPTMGYGGAPAPSSHRQPTSAATPVAMGHAATNQGGYGLPVLAPPSGGQGAPTTPSADPALAPTDPSAIPSRAPSSPDGVASGVSPLAVSNLNSQRGAFDEVAGGAVSAAAGAAEKPSPEKKPIPGTQVMQAPPSFLAPSAPAAAEPSAPPPKRQDKTQVLGFQMPPPIATGATGGAASEVAPPIAQPASQYGQPSQAQPPAASSYGQPPQAQPPAPSQYGQAPQPGASQYGQQGYGSAGAFGAAPAAAAAAPAWGGPGYVPGANVQVTWSNGVRYPATVQQVNGNMCLVAFPDGQQHWVDLQYVSPG